MSGLKDPNAKALATKSLMSTPLTSPIHLFMKIMKIGVLEEEGILGDLSVLKINAPEFDENLKLKNYLGYLQNIERILELKEYNVEKAFKLVILKMKGMHPCGMRT